MTVDDTTAIACITALAAAVAVLWKLNDNRQKASEHRCRGELAKRDDDIEDCIKRIRKLEDERVPVYRAHTAEIRELAESMRSTTERVGKSIDALGKSVLDLVRNSTPHPTAAEPETAAVVRIGRDHA